MCPQRLGPHFVAPMTAHRGGKERSTRTGLCDCFYSNHQVCPNEELPKTLLHLTGKGSGSGKRDLLLLSLQREVKMEPGMLGDHSDYSHCLSLQGTEDGLPCPRLGVGSQSCPPEQYSI